MHQEHITSRCSIFDDLKRYSIDLFDAFVETSDTTCRIASGTQIPKVRMLLEPSPELDTSTSTLWRRILRKPPVHQAVGSADDVGAATMWCDVSQHRVHLHAGGRQQAALVIAINVPTRAGHIPFISRGELQEECAPITRSLPWLSFLHLVDRADRALAADCAKNGIAFKVLQMVRSRCRPS